MPRSFIVARAEVDHDIRLRQEDQAADVRVGEPFKVVLAYRCHEVSRDKDEWHFRLTSILAGDERMVEETLEDRRGRRDAIWSNVAVEHTCRRAGEHVLSFRAEVKTSRHGWGEVATRSTKEQAFEGTVKVRAV